MLAINLFLSKIKNIFGSTTPLLFSVAEGTTLILNELELVLIKEEELPTLSTTLQQYI